MYSEEDYDLAGFAVGIVEKSRLITGASIEPGHFLIGLPASGIHSNGYSLVRKIFFEPELGGKTLGEELLTPTRIYVSAVLPLLEKQLIDGISHITGGGFIENIPRMLPPQTTAEITLGTWPQLPIFEALASYGKIPAHEMYEIFNMGIGMVLAVAPEKKEQVLALLNEQNEAAYVIGKVTEAQEHAVLLQGDPL